MYLSQHGAVTHIGQRSNNEDCYYGSMWAGLWVVADGMGGHAAGEVASDIVIQTIKSLNAKSIHLPDAIQKSHKAVISAAQQGIGGQGMGATVVALKSHKDIYEISWVGDSRAYSWSHSELQQLTTDHSYVQMLFQSGAIAEDELENHPEKNIITQCLGSEELENVKVDTLRRPWKKNEWIILCSDGLSDMLPATEISSILTQSESTSIAAEKLVNAAVKAGGKDNITVQVVSAPKNNIEGSAKVLFATLKRSINNIFSK